MRAVVEALARRDPAALEKWLRDAEDQIQMEKFSTGS
jgi:hypothetical protein